MLDLHLIREKPDIVRNALRRRGLPTDTVDAFLALDHDHREVLQRIEALRRTVKEFASGAARHDPNARALAKEKREELHTLEEEERTLRRAIAEMLEGFPNIPADDVPDGPDASANVVVREGGTKREFSFSPRDYLELAEPLDCIDMARGARVAGSRFSYLKREVAMLEFALVNYAVKRLVREGFIPVIPPVMIRPEVYRGMGRLAADQRAERYYLPQDDLYLVGSAEHTLGPLHMDEVLSEGELPLRYVGFSTCFRREAGSYGKDTRGILRVHQFDKVEMFVFTRPEESDAELERLVRWQEDLVGGLGLPYRIVAISTGDMGWTDARQFDVEVWLPGQKRWVETHSASNTTDFQARGINARFRRHGGSGKPEFLHMLNATALAIGRTIIAILENYQQEDGSVAAPEVLREFCDFDRIPSLPR